MGRVRAAPVVPAARAAWGGGAVVVTGEGTIGAGSVTVGTAVAGDVAGPAGPVGVVVGASAAVLDDASTVVGSSIGAATSSAVSSPRVASTNPATPTRTMPTTTIVRRRVAHRPAAPGPPTAAVTPPPLSAPEPPDVPVSVPELAGRAGLGAGASGGAGLGAGGRVAGGGCRDAGGGEGGGGGGLDAGGGRDEGGGGEHGFGAERQGPPVVAVAAAAGVRGDHRGGVAVEAGGPGVGEQGPQGVAVTPARQRTTPEPVSCTARSRLSSATGSSAWTITVSEPTSVRPGVSSFWLTRRTLDLAEPRSGGPAVVGAGQAGTGHPAGTVRRDDRRYRPIPRSRLADR